MDRLLTFAKESTKGKPGAVADFSDLRERLGESQATFTNWKTRGISRDGALKAERKFGCSASWLLTGRGERFVVRAPGEPSPAISLQEALDVIAAKTEKSDEIAQLSLRLLVSVLRRDTPETVNLSHASDTSSKTYVAQGAGSENVGQGSKTELSKTIPTTRYSGPDTDEQSSPLSPKKNGTQDNRPR